MRKNADKNGWHNGANSNLGEFAAQNGAKGAEISRENGVNFGENCGEILSEISRENGEKLRKNSAENGEISREIPAQKRRFLRRAVAFTGKSGSGKTTLVAQLARRLIARGFAVAIVKHDPGDKARFDSEGKDSFIYSQLGANVGVVSPTRTTIFLREGLFGGFGRGGAAHKSEQFCAENGENLAQNLAQNGEISAQNSDKTAPNSNLNELATENAIENGAKNGENPARNSAQNSGKTAPNSNLNGTTPRAVNMGEENGANSNLNNPAPRNPSDISSNSNLGELVTENTRENSAQTAPNSNLDETPANSPQKFAKTPAPAAQKFGKNADEMHADLRKLAAHFGDFDYLLVEGLKFLPLPRLCVVRGELDAQYLEFARAAASDIAGALRAAGFGGEIFALDAYEKIISWLDENAICL